MLSQIQVKSQLIHCLSYWMHVSIKAMELFVANASIITGIDQLIQKSRNVKRVPIDVWLVGIELRRNSTELTITFHLQTPFWKNTVDYAMHLMKIYHPVKKSLMILIWICHLNAIRQLNKLENVLNRLKLISSCFVKVVSTLRSIMLLLFLTEVIYLV